MKKINLKSAVDVDGDKDKSPKVEIHTSTNAPGIDKKKTQIQGGVSVKVKEKTVNLPANNKYSAFKLESKAMQPIKKLKGKFEKKGEVMPTGKHTQSGLTKTYGKSLAKKTIKAGEKTDRVTESSKTMMVGKQTKHYQSALKKK